jgi:acyl CoA:acetate/3-ketoacid CoA transferase
VDLRRDVLEQAGMALQVAPDLRLMEERLFHEPAFGLALQAREVRRG